MDMLKYSIKNKIRNIKKNIELWCYRYNFLNILLYIYNAVSTWNLYKKNNEKIDKI